MAADLREKTVMAYENDPVPGLVVPMRNMRRGRWGQMLLGNKVFDIGNSVAFYRFLTAFSRSAAVDGPRRSPPLDDMQARLYEIL